MRRSFSRTCTRVVPAVLLAAGLGLAAPRAGAAPWMWDQDQDGIDDRLQTVSVNGLTWAFENLDPEGRLRFEVETVESALEYGGYVRFDHIPTASDETLLEGLGADVITRFLSVPYIRVRALYPSLTLIAAQPGVERVEAVSLMYPVNFTEGRALAVRRGKGAPRITVEGAAGLTGDGVTVAVLDTGINDEVQGTYPGHVDLQGRVVGGASFDGPGPTGYSAWAASTNPLQGTVGLSSYHATHVAASVAGGTRDRTLGGVAPGARLVDVKVLDDNGLGYGLAEGLEWCLQNRNRDWGGGPAGIQVVNLSLSGTDLSFGDDCVCALVDSAVAGGIVVVAAAGNDASCGALPAPGAADGAITVAAYDPATGTPAAFSNEGPRPDDDDGDHADEMKPDVSAPGVNVASAWGGPLSNGRAYAKASGTSMAAAFASGTAALLLEGNPALTPAQIKTLFRDTAVHETSAVLGCGVGADPYGLDARYHPAWGWGRLQAYAAVAEAQHPTRTQFLDVAPVWDQGTGQVHVGWTTQREADLTGFLVERADDAGGVPGTFATVGSPMPAVGFATLASGNRTDYEAADTPPAGVQVWYRVVTTGGSQSDASPAMAVRTEDPVAVAAFSFTHNAPETDLVLTLGTGAIPQYPDWSSPIDVFSTLDSLRLDLLIGATSLVRYDGSLPLYPGLGAAGHLPPGSGSPWWFRGVEGGFPDRSGRLDGFSMDVGGTGYATDSTVPQSTSEGSATLLWMPEITITAVPGDLGPGRPVLTTAPNPFRQRLNLSVHVDGPAGPASVTVHDVSGRVVRTIYEGVLDPGDHPLTWDGADDRGRPLPAGRYFLCLSRGAGRTVRSVLRLP